MKKELVLLLCLFLVTFSLSGCSQAEKKVVAAERVDSRLVKANTDFAFRLFAQLRGPKQDKNIFFSPASVAFALGMVYNGAEGQTQEEMAQALGLGNLSLEDLNKANADLLTILKSPDPKVETSIANSLWPDDDLTVLGDFLQRSRDYYDAEVKTIDYGKPGAHNIINRWVEKETKGKIKDLFSDLQADVRLVLVNTLYFNGQWTKEFDKNNTQEASFSLLDGSEKEVPLMYKEDDFDGYAGESFKAVRLPYGQERLSMYVFVPDTSLNDFYQQLNAENWQQWLSSFAKKEVKVFLPRFKAEYKQELNDALKQMGMRRAFDPELADFRKMADEDLYVGSVIHQAYIDVHEKGTEAAAATGVVMKTTSAPLDEPFVVRADRPFFFAICDDLTDSILFMGEVTNP